MVFPKTPWLTGRLGSLNIQAKILYLHTSLYHTWYYLQAAKQAAGHGGGRAVHCSVLKHRTKPATY
jgi:hypothetical protein